MCFAEQTSHHKIYDIERELSKTNYSAKGELFVYSEIKSLFLYGQSNREPLITRFSTARYEIINYPIMTNFFILTAGGNVNVTVPSDIRVV